MTGLLQKKYHIAILDSDNNFVAKMAGALKEWGSKIVIKTYSDTHSMFEAVNVNKAKNKPFDMAIMSTDAQIERMVLQRANPSLKVVTCDDEKTLQNEASKLLL